MLGEKNNKPHMFSMLAVDLTNEAKKKKNLYQERVKNTLYKKKHISGKGIMQLQYDNIL